MGLTIESIEALLLYAAVVSMLARKLRLPYTVGLVLAGIPIALLPGVPEMQLTKELIFSALLPPLIFEAAFHMPWPQLRKDIVPILALATIGVLVSVALTTVGMRYAAGWDWRVALLFAVPISATDPVSVIATFRELKVEGRLRLLVEAESLFNDGVVAVAFVVALQFVRGGPVGIGSVGLSFLAGAAGGLACGGLVGLVVLLLVGRTADHLIEITFSSVAAYGSFLLAEHFGFSGVLATLTAGIIVGNVSGLGQFSKKGRDEVASFWAYVGFVANCLIFLLIGMRLAHHRLAEAWAPAACAIGVVLVARAASVYGVCGLFHLSGRKVALRNQHVLVWGGLRGALALALVLGLPPEIRRNSSLETVAFIVVAFSIVVQGVTITPLLRRTGEATPRAAAG